MGILIRVVVAVLAALLAYGIIPLTLEILGFPMSVAVATLFKYIIAGIAIFYIIFGPTPQWPKTS